jgi:hypothetical protein
MVVVEERWMVGGVVDMGMYRGPGPGVVVENCFKMLVLRG